MNNKLCALVAISLLGLAIATPTIASDDGVLRARLGLSDNSFTTLYSGGDMEVDYTSLNMGVTWIRPDALYLDLAYKQDLGASWNTRELTGFSDEDYSRADITLTVGKALDNGVQVFAGYQNSQTDIALPAAWGMVSEEEFNISGFFLGAGRSFKVGEGSLNLNAALGYMDAELYDGGGVWHDSKKGSGHSLGASYTLFLSEGLAANIELKQQNYDYDFDDDAPLTSGDDKMTMIGINLVRQF